MQKTCKDIHTQKEGVIVSNEWNIVNDETKDNSAETRSGEDKGVKDDNKIVPIINKTQSAESKKQVSTAEMAAQLVAQYASLPLAKAVGQPVLQAMAQAANQQTVQTSAPAMTQAASQQAVQSVSQTASEASQAPVREEAVQSDVEPAISEIRNTDSASVKDFERKNKKRRFFRGEPEEDDEFDLDEEERPKKRFFRLRSADNEETRDQIILSRIKDEDLMEYLALEQRRLEFLQQAKEAKEKRILIAFQLLISLAAIVGITYLLQDNPTILISILYIVGIVAALNVWKNPHDKGRPKR